jgi:protein ImuB
MNESPMTSIHAVRSLVVWCLDWPVSALDRDSERPCAVVHSNRVVACSPEARAHGVSRGLRRREAQRRCPHLEVVERDVALEARIFERVASALDDLTPRVEIIRPGMVVFPTIGPSRYFGGDEAMAHRCVGLVAGVSAKFGAVRIGVADGVFAASVATRTAPDNGIHVVESGGSAAFLAPKPVRLLERPELASVLERLGIITLGALAALDHSDVVGRFGREGEIAHRLATGLDERPPAVAEPPADMEVVADLDPPLDRVDQAAFMGKVLADQLLDRLYERSASCTAIVVSATTGQGEELSRQWRNDGAITSAAVADRVRWQLDGWLNGSRGRRPTSGIVRLSVRPTDVVPAGGRQLGFWGGRSGAGEQAARTIARLQGLLGPEAIRVPERRGGRSPGELVVTVPADTVDLDRPSIDGGAQELPWPGRLPDPAPARLHRRLDAEVIDERGEPVRVDSRALLSSTPYQARLGPQSWMEIVSWAGPWPLDERWWDSERARRCARLQVVVDDGSAHVLVIEGGQWRVEATYD